MNRSIAALALVATGLGGACRAEDSGPPVRIVLITVDTLRKDAWEADAKGRVPMQRTLDRALEGLVFEHAYAASSSTQPTHVSLFTGLHPWEHGISRNGLRIGSRTELLAERLTRAGFECHAVVSSFPVSGVYGFARGFASFDDEFDRALVDSAAWNETAVGEDGFYTLGDEVTRRALAVLDAAGGRRQFLWVHYFDPHDPYGDSFRVPVEEEEDDTGAPRAQSVKEVDVATLRQAARARDTRLAPALVKARSLYRADVERLDVWMDTLLARLEADADEFATHVVITSDHGESFGEDGSIGHGHRVTPVQVHVPLAVISPRVERPAALGVPAGSVDVHATLLDLAGLPAAAGSGISLLETPAGLALRESSGFVYGMRRTFAEPRLDSRTDGSTPAMDEPQFFGASAEGFFMGNGSGIVRYPGEAPSEFLPVLDRFTVFEAELAGQEADEVTDEASLEALRKLGYAR